jgi:hypothetical protein
MAIPFQKFQIGMGRNYGILCNLGDCGWQYYAGAALGSFAGIVLAMIVHSTVVATI